MTGGRRSVAGDDGSMEDDDDEEDGVAESVCWLSATCGRCGALVEDATCWNCGAPRVAGR